MTLRVRRHCGRRALAERPRHPVSDAGTDLFSGRRPRARSGKRPPTSAPGRRSRPGGRAIRTTRGRHPALLTLPIQELFGLLHEARGEPAEDHGVVGQTEHSEQPFGHEVHGRHDIASRGEHEDEPAHRGALVPARGGRPHEARHGPGPLTERRTTGTHRHPERPHDGTDRGDTGERRHASSCSEPGPVDPARQRTTYAARSRSLRRIPRRSQPGPPPGTRAGRWSPRYASSTRRVRHRSHRRRRG